MRNIDAYYNVIVSNNICCNS